MIVLFVFVLLERAVSQGGFASLECVVAAAHSPVVLSDIAFTIDCSTDLDLEKRLTLMAVNVTSSIDGLIFESPDMTEAVGNDGFSLEGLKVSSLGGHYFTVDVKLDMEYRANNSATSESLSSGEANAKCIHGIASVLPPIAVLLVCLITKEVLLGLPFSIWFGAWLCDPDWNPVTSFWRVWDTYYIEAIANVDHAFVICFTIFLGGLVKIMENTGGTKGVADEIAKKVKSSAGAVMGVFIVGLLIFFDDYADCLISGYTFMPLMDKYRVSREKFSFIVDATAAPIASIAPLSSWVGFELGLIGDYFTAADVWEDDNVPGDYISFIKTIPYRFYPIFMLWFMFFTLFLSLDFGPMLKAEARAKITGKVARQEKENTDGHDEQLKNEILELETSESRPLNAIIPMGVVVFVTILAYILTGVNNCRLDGLSYTSTNIFSEGDSWGALLYGVVLGNLSAFIVASFQYTTDSNGQKVKLATLKDLFAWYFEGVGYLCRPLFGILMFAWCLNGVVTDMSLGDYMISSIGDSVDIEALPFISFIISGLISLFIGSSWATMSVMFPLIVPLALYISGNDQEATIAVMGTILAGSVWGDHCSPISDTTILSSMAAGCDHNDHVATQLPYAVFVAFFSSIFGDLCVGYMGFEFPYIGIFMGLLLMSVATWFISSRVPSFTPGGKEVTEDDFHYSLFHEKTKDISCICWKQRKGDMMKSEDFDNILQCTNDHDHL